MSNRLFQGIVHQMRDAIDRTVGVVDETMTVCASSDLSIIGEKVQFGFSELSEKAGDLLIPYILWLSFALYLNFGIFILN